MEYVNHNRLTIVSVVLLFIVGISAIAAGCAFIAEPSGKLLGLTPGLLKYSPFSDFLIPGLILLNANGVLSILIAVLAIRKVKGYPYLIILQGCILMGWIIIQIMLLHLFNLMHLIFGAVGIFLTITGILVRNKYSP